ncbi:702_t:CDS:2 [Funneliformis mosseae]|uniref:702_t:CDS:1 n=1 Tax=Funneliformis mosseae TaxID=27381 RepID=A0A9N9FPJ6_FUNMO|nr:702_t:CDS:2 [Funneliformis mosseae]
MDANPNQRENKYGYSRKEIKEGFEQADKEIPISCAVYKSRAFKHLTKPINSSLITSYLEKYENNEESGNTLVLMDVRVQCNVIQFYEVLDIGVGANFNNALVARI